MTKPECTIRVKVVPTNPGQFFACCGLLELAGRLRPGAEGWFEGRDFCLRTVATSPDASVTNALIACTLTNTMTPAHLARRAELGAMGSRELKKIPGFEDEKKALEKLHRELPITLHHPFSLQIDWFLDDFAGGSRFKTWAGQQSVFVIADAMKKAINAPVWQTLTPDQWLIQSDNGCGLPFNFDSDLGGQGSALDLGFSFDPLAASATTKIASTVRPGLELLAFVGLQRFRPRQLLNDNRFLYCLWNRPLPPEIAAPAACGLIPTQGSESFEFRLLYRTKYLKSFLPAIPYSGDSNE